MQCFRSFDKAKIQKMADFIREHEFDADETIIRQQNSSDSMYIIKSGLISILRVPESDEQERIDQICLTKLSSGDIFGESTAIEDQGLGGLFPYSAVCETKAVCYRLDKNQIDRCGWDPNTKRLLYIMAVKYPGDAILVQAFKNRKRSIQIRKKVRKELRKSLY